MKGIKTQIRHFTGSSDKFDPLQCTYLYMVQHWTKKPCTVCRRTCKVSLRTQRKLAWEPCTWWYVKVSLGTQWTHALHFLASPTSVLLQCVITSQ